MILSVIVPVYNVEKYLERCLNSVLDQQVEEMEILLIDDGSTDNSALICQEFAKKDKRIKVFHKKNGGLSDARNFGLKHAIGKYVVFLDSDDFIVKDAYEKLINKAELNDLDIVTANAINYVSENDQTPKIKKRRINDEIYDGAEFLAFSIREQCMSMCSVLGIYRRELILENNLFFKKGLLHEDELWTPQVYLSAKKVMYIDFDFYMHYQREGSITQSKDKTNNALHLIFICETLANVYSSEKNDSYREVFNDYLVTLYLNAFYVGKLYRKKYKQSIDKSFLNTKPYSIKNKIKVIVFKFNGKFYYLINTLSKQLLKM